MTAVVFNFPAAALPGFIELPMNNGKTVIALLADLRFEWFTNHAGEGCDPLVSVYWGKSAFSETTDVRLSELRAALRRSEAIAAGGPVRHSCLPIDVAEYRPLMRALKEMSDLMGDGGPAAVTPETLEKVRRTYNALPMNGCPVE